MTTKQSAPEAGETKLLACPFCGNDARVMTEGKSFFVACEADDCPVNPSTRCGSTEAKTITVWNRRAASREAGAWKTVPRKPTPVQLEQAASNLADEFGVDFVLANEQFALAVYDEMLAASPSPPPVGVGKPDRAFDIGWAWAHKMREDGPVRDARDVMRSLGCHLFDGLTIEADIGLHDSRDDAIVKANRAIKAALAAPPVGGEVVKLLEWRTTMGQDCIADACFGGLYSIQFYAGMELPAKLETRGWYDGLPSMYESMEAAKAAAQADFERRIRSALVTSSPSLLEEVGEALRKARKRMRNCRGAIESDQVVDKDVHGNLTRGMADIDAVLAKLGPAP